ncbi:MAG: amino acid adenylation domain-containing protein [Candidatus Omnitrophota bacterium]
MNNQQVSSFEQLWISAGSKIKEREYWLNKLSGDFIKSSFPSNPGYVERDALDQDPGIVIFILDGDLYTGLMRLSADSNIRLHIVLASILTLLLEKYTGNPDVIIGIPILKTDANPNTGMVNTLLPVRSRLTEKMTIRELVLQVRRTIIEADEHRNYPLEVLIRQLNLPEWDQGKEFPLFDTAMLLENIHEIYHLTHVKPKVTFSFLRTSETIRCHLKYLTRFYHQSTMDRIAAHFQLLVGIFLGDIETKIKDIELLLEKERKQLIYDFNNTSAAYPKHQTIHGLFENEAEKNPDHLGVSGEFGQLTYGELNERSGKVARYLTEKGFGLGDIAAIKIERSLEMIIGFLGILKAGGAYLPMEPDFPAERIAYMLKDSGARIILTESDIVLSSAMAVTDLSPAPARSKEVAYIIYTSGSTGKPKGVMVEHTSLVNLLWYQRKRYELGENERSLHFSSICFDASVEQMFIALCMGIILVLVSKKTILNIENFELFIARQAVTHLHVVPAFLVQLRMKQLYSIRRLITGGENCPVEVVKKWCGQCMFFNEYGPTETTVTSVELKVKELNEKLSALPIGQPVGNTIVYVLDKRMHLTPVGVPGELYIGGAGVARGYLNRPEYTSDVFISRIPFLPKGQNTRLYKRLYKTGDLTRWSTDGNLEYLGRVDFQLKIRGFRIEPGEIENHLLKHPEIKEAHVMVREGKKGEKYLCAYIVPLHFSEELGETVDGSSRLKLREYLSRSLPDYMIPSIFGFLKKMPVNNSGKVDARALPDLQMGKHKSGSVYVAPRDEFEQRLANIWAEVLNVEPGIDDNFFELGGHSLKAATLVYRVYKEFEVNIEIADVFQHSTIRNISRHIKGLQKVQFHSLCPVEKKYFYPVSSAQKRLFIIQQVTGENTGYNMPAVLELTGRIDNEKLERVFKHLISRHESLRTSFHIMDGAIVQRIHEQVEFGIAFNTYDVEQIKNGSFVRPFDLGKAPLIRVELIKIKKTTHLLMIDMHHIISDGTSMGILVKEFMALYHGDELPSPFIQYRDFSEWQAGERQVEINNEQEAYWLKDLEGEIPVLDLALDYTRPAERSFAGEVLDFEIGARETTKLKALASEANATLYMVLLSIYYIFLSRITGTEDIIVGTPVAGRRHIELQGVIGMFVNTLALRNFPLGNKTFHAFLEEIKTRTLEAFANQDYPYEELFEKIIVAKHPGRNSLFDTLFILQNMEIPKIEVPGLKIKMFSKEKIQRTSKFDISLIAKEVGKKLSFSFEYCTALFQEKTIRRFIVFFKNLVTSVVKNKNGKISNFDIMTEDEKHRLLIDFNNVNNVNNCVTDYPKDQTIHELFIAQAERTPDRIALIDRDGRVFSYRQLSTLSDYLAYALIRRGVTPETIVGLGVERSVEMIVGILGILKSGAGYLPLDQDLPRERIDFMIRDSGARIVLTINEIRSAVNADTQPSSVSEKFPTHSVNGHQNKQENLLYIIYTSGTTGRPKGVMLKHRNLINLIHDQYRHSSIDFSRVLQFAAIGFDVSFQEIFSALLAGGALVLIDKKNRFNVNALLYWVDMHGIKTLFFPTAFIHLLSGEERYLESIPSVVEHIIVAGEQLIISRNFRHFLIRRRIKLHNHYGPSETHVVTTFCIHPELLAEAEERHFSPIGKPTSHTSIYILSVHGNLQPIGIGGELFIGGIQVGKGYLNNPELTSDKFITPIKETQTKRFCPAFYKKRAAGGVLYKTGDLARWLEDGNILFLGRIDHQVKIRGFRIELGEIESELLKHPGIKEAVVLIKENMQKNDRYLCAYIVSELELTRSELRDFLSNYLPDYMLPSYFIVLKQMPLTPNGKVNKVALPEPETQIDNRYVAPRDDIEKKLAQIWADILGASTSPGIDDNFFELGGHSLKAARMTARIYQAFHINVSLEELFKNPTIRGLSSLFEAIRLAGCTQKVEIDNEDIEEVIL